MIQIIKTLTVTYNAMSKVSVDCLIAKDLIFSFSALCRFQSFRIWKIAKMSDRRLGAQRTFAKVPISKYKCMETQV